MRARIVAIAVGGTLLLVPSMGSAQLGVSVGVDYVFDGGAAGFGLSYADYGLVSPIGFKSYALGHRRWHPRPVYDRLCWDGHGHYDAYHHPRWGYGCWDRYDGFSLSVSFGFGTHPYRYGHGYGSAYGYRHPVFYPVHRPWYRVGYPSYAFVYHPRVYPTYTHYVYRPYPYPDPAYRYGYPAVRTVRHAVPRLATVGSVGYGTGYKESPRATATRTVRAASTGPAARTVRQTEVRRDRPSAALSGRTVAGSSPTSARAPARTLERPTDRLRTIRGNGRSGASENERAGRRPSGSTAAPAAASRRSPVSPASAAAPSRPSARASSGRSTRAAPDVGTRATPSRTSRGAPSRATIPAPSRSTRVAPTRTSAERPSVRAGGAPSSAGRSRPAPRSSGVGRAAPSPRSAPTVRSQGGGRTPSARTPSRGGSRARPR